MKSSNKQSDEIYEPKGILLTGGAGFIGSHVLSSMLRKYHKIPIVCIDKLDYCGTMKNFDDFKDFSNFFFVKGDILSSDLVTFILKNWKIDTILHFAAQSHVDNSFGNSLSFTRNNVLGTHVLLEVARCIGNIRKFIHVSTDEVYGQTRFEDDRLFIESDVLSPSNPYSASKAAAEQLVLAYYTSFQLPIIITRGNNVYGPRQFPEKLIPKFVLLLQNGKACPLHGSGDNRRSYIYVDDVTAAFDTILNRGEIGQIYNIGTNIEISNFDVARTLLKYFNLENRENDFVCKVPDRHFNDCRYRIDNSKLLQLDTPHIGWCPKTTFIDGIINTVKWYSENPNYFGEIDRFLVPHPNIVLDNF